MEFFIRQGATDPILKLKLIDDGKNDKSSFNDLLESSTITFDMVDVKTGEPEVLDAPCSIINRIKKYNQTTDEYYIIFRFNEEQTKNQGRYEGKVTILFDNGNKLIVPIQKKLYINIV